MHEEIQEFEEVQTPEQNKGNIDPVSRPTTA